MGSHCLGHFCWLLSLFEEDEDEFLPSPPDQNGYTLFPFTPRKQPLSCPWFQPSFEVLRAVLVFV
jgi:hypothetical protein